MRTWKKVVTVIVLSVLFLAGQTAWASLGETAGEVGKNAVATGMDLVKLPVDLVKTVGYSLKLVGEVIVFPFTLL